MENNKIINFEGRRIDSKNLDAMTIGEFKVLMQQAVNGDIIISSCVQDMQEMNRRKELLEKHPNKIWQGTDGKWRTYLPTKDNGRRLLKRSSKAAVEDEIIRYWKDKLENPTIKQVFGEWNDRRLDLKKISPATHLRNQQTFNRHYSEFGDREIKSVEPEEIEEFLEEQISKYDLTAKSFSNLKTVTKGFLRRAKKRKLIDFDVEVLFQELDTSESDFKRRIKEDYQEVFSEDEMPVIMDYLENNLDVQNIAILLMFVTGARVGEIVALKHSDFEGCSFKIRRTESRYKENEVYVCRVKEFPKTQAGVRTAIIPKEFEWLVRKIHILNPFSEYVFMKDGERIHTQAVRMRLKRICAKLHIYHKSPHKIRKTYGSILLDNKIDNQLIIGQMGHTNILCTEEHYHRNRRGIERKQEILSAIPEFRLKEKQSEHKF